MTIKRPQIAAIIILSAAIVVGIHLDFPGGSRNSPPDGMRLGNADQQASPISPSATKSKSKRRLDSESAGELGAPKVSGLAAATGTKAEQDSLSTAISEAQRSVQPLTEREQGLAGNEGVRYFASNPNQHFTARFRDSDVLLRSSGIDEPWQASFSVRALAGMGVANRAEATVEGARLEYSYLEGITEWFENQAEGLQHGFTIHQAPAEGSAGFLRIDLAVKGLDVRPGLDGTEVEWVSPESGKPVMAYSRLQVTDTTGRRLSAKIGVHERAGFSIEISDASASYPLTVSGVLVPRAYEAEIFAKKPNLSDMFGYSIAISGNTLIVGAFGTNTAAGEIAGSAYIFIRKNVGVWSLQAKITAADGSDRAYFGTAVAISGDTAVIGASGTKTVGKGWLGGAYVFDRIDGKWTQRAKLPSGDGVGNLAFGESVAISGDTVILGTPRGGADTGDSLESTAEVFVRNNGLWTHQATLVPPAPRSHDDEFGTSVSISGNTAVIGSPDTWVDGVPAGAAFVFVRAGNQWSQQAVLVPDDLFEFGYGIRAGWSVAVSGDSAIVGAPHHHSGLVSSAGCAYIYARTGQVWSQQAQVFDAEPVTHGRFGSSVAISENHALVGRPGVSDKSSGNFPAVSVFARNGSEWSPLARLEAANKEDGRPFGNYLGLSGNNGVIAGTGDKVINSKGDVVEAGNVSVFRVAPELAVYNSEGILLKRNSPAGRTWPISPGMRDFDRYTLKNVGLYPLKGVSARFKGGNPLQFRMRKKPAVEIPPGGSTVVEIQFAPKKVGDFETVLQIKTNDSDEGSFEIKLKGKCKVLAPGL